MRLQILLLLPTVFIVSCESKLTDLKRQNLNGQVKSIKETWYQTEEKFGELVGTKVTSVAIYKYNEDGQINQEDFYNLKGELEYRKVYTHNQTGTTTGYKRYSGDGVLVESVYYVLDDEENVIEERYMPISGELTVLISTYKGGRLIERKNKETKSDKGVYKYTYTKDGYLSEIKVFESKDSYSFRNPDEKKNPQELIRNYNTIKIKIGYEYEYY